MERNRSNLNEQRKAERVLHVYHGILKENCISIEVGVLIWIRGKANISMRKFKFGAEIMAQIYTVNFKNGYRYCNNLQMNRQLLRRTSPCFWPYSF